MAQPTYDSFVSTELLEAGRRYYQGHGIGASTADFAHFAWQRLRDGREYQNWLLAAEKKDLEDVPWVMEPEDGDVPGPDPLVLPDRETTRRWYGNFLALPGFEYAFMYPGWSLEKQAMFRTAYRAAGYTHVPLGIQGAYPGHLPFDYRGRPDAYRALLVDLLDAALIPCVFLHTDAVQPPRPTLDQLVWALESFIPVIHDAVPCYCLGWEFPQIDQPWEGWWTWNGEMLTEFAKRVRRLIGDRMLYVHFPPERITGRPHYAHDDPTGDEVQWWRDTPEIDGLLYQRWYDEPEDVLLAHTLGGDGDVGDVNRIAGDYWGLNPPRDMVIFEHSREPERWRRIADAVLAHPLVKGVC